MKLKVLKVFRDKYTNERYEAGSIIEPADERAEELLIAKGGLVEKIEDAPAEEVVKENLTTESAKSRSRKNRK